MTHWIESGSPTAPVWFVGEAPGEREVEQGAPLVGPSGHELTRMLQEAGWPPQPFFKTNICHQRPPSYHKAGKWVHNDIEQFFAGKKAAASDGLSEAHGRYPRHPVTEGLARLSRLSQQHHPRLIIALGGTALWGLTGKDSITKWRGSVLPALPAYGEAKCLATLHPAIVVDPQKGQYTYRPVITQDLRRALRESETSEIRTPAWDFTVAPTLSQVRDWLIPCIEDSTPLVCDTEGWGVVDCIGFGSSSTRAICIPFTRGDGTSFYSPEDELAVFAVCHSALTRCPITFHNAIWDMQVIGKNWGFLPRLADDTMVAQHCAFPGMLGGKIDPVTGRTTKQGSSLSLSFCASMYCDQYRFWKDDGRVRNPLATDEDEWRYNCEDCARTWEVQENLARILLAAGLTDQYRFLMSLFRPVLKMMFRGIRVDKEKALALRTEMTQKRLEQQVWLQATLGHPLNVHATAAGREMQALFYEDLACDPVRSRKSGQLSTDDEALDTIARRNPALLPLVRTIQNIRSLDTNEANFLRPVLGGFDAQGRRVDPCGDRLRTCLNIAGAETFRFTSNETAFGEGMNLQNLTRPET